MTDDDHFGQNNPITLTINQSFVSNDDHFGHTSPSLWVYIYVYIYISRFVGRKIVTLTIHLHLIGHKLPGYASRTHV